MLFFLLVLLALSIIYALFLVWCRQGWRKIEAPTSNLNSKTSVSIVVAARNEERNIENLLTDILSQEFASNLFEIIVVNDQSTDQTAEVVHQFVERNKDYRIHLLEASPAGGKKNALAQAIHLSTGELIVTTDADCRMGKKWLSSIVSFYETNQSFMISAPVKYADEKNRFEKIQSLEFMGLIAIGAGAIANHRPIMCNGANLAFQKDIFYKINGYEAERVLATGDDTQLLLKIAKLNPTKVHFLKSKEATVTTSAASNLKQLFNQRKRWASKIPVQMNLFTLFMAAVAFLLNAGLLAGFVFIPTGHYSTIIVLAFVLKFIVEFLLLNSVASFMKKKKLLWLLLPAQFLYIFYVIVIGTASLFRKYEWKGRKVVDD